MGFGDVPRKCSAYPLCAHLVGDCCPASTGMRLACCGNEVVSEAWAWLSLVIACTFATLGGIFLVIVLPRAPSKFKREVSVALTSGVVYLLMSLPMFLSHIWRTFPDSLRGSYIYLPFWYAFVLTKYLGTHFEVATFSACGTLISVLVMVLLNYCLPGGASPYSKSEDALAFSWTGWMGEGYKPWFAWLFSACYVYGIFLSRWHSCMKQYALGFFASVIVGFMDKQSTYGSFQAILWNWNFQWNWDGTVLCSVYITLLAIPLTGLSLPIIPGFRGLRRFFSCRASASRGLSLLAADTWGCLDRLITYFEEDKVNFDVESSFLYIRQLGSRRSDIEELLVQAKWECINNTTIARLHCLVQVSALLRDLRQALRVQLEQVRGARFSPAHGYTEKVCPHLGVFLDGMNDALSCIVSWPNLHKGLTREELEAIICSASTANSALLEALEKVPRTHQRERIFLDCLRNFPRAMDTFAKDALAEMDQAPKTRCHSFNLRRFLSDWSPHHVWCMKEQHSHAVRNTCSWLLALFWSTMVKRATCVTTVSFLFSPSLGSLFDRNVNRMLGVGMGLALGNLPAVILLKQDCGDDRLENRCFIHYPQGPIVYLQFMFAQWSLAMYGYLATGSKYSYACLLWAGFSGVQMLRSLQTKSAVTDSQLFESTMDNMLGCFIVFAVDIVAAHVTRCRTAEQVTKSISRGFTRLSDIITRLKECESASDVFPDLARLKKSIESSRYWDEECRKEDFVWTSARLMPYNADLVNALLNGLDDSYVAIWSTLAAADRCGQEHTMRNLFKELLPEGLVLRCQLYGRVVAVVLREEDRKKCAVVEGVKSDPDMDRRYTPESFRFGDGDEEAPTSESIDSSRVARASPTEEGGGCGSDMELGATAGTGQVTRMNTESQGSAHSTEVHRLSTPWRLCISLDAAGGATILTLQADCNALRTAMQRVQALLEEHTFLSAKDWRPPEVEEPTNDILALPSKCGTQRGKEPSFRFPSSFRDELSVQEEEDEEASSTSC